MKLIEFRINSEFICGVKKWRCTDLGQRVVIAICVTDHDKDQTWLNGPPYAIVETVFDEEDQSNSNITIPNPIKEQYLRPCVF